MNSNKSTQQSQPENFVRNRRILSGCRIQYEMKYSCLDDLIDIDHPARRVMGYVEELNPLSLTKKIKSIEGGPGRPAIDPKILLALWLYATVEGIGSAWMLADYCEQHSGFKWICGGLSIDRKTLSNFRVENGEIFNQLLIESVAILLQSGVVTLNEIAQDGMRVRASAGKHSFHRKKTIERHFKEAKERVEFLKKELQQDPSSGCKRVELCRKQAAVDRAKRLQQAKEELKRFTDEKNKNRTKHKKKPLTKEEQAELRVSTTDPEARNMKMANGGFRPAFNFQFAVDTGSQIVVGVDVSKSGNDGGNMLPMCQKIIKSYKKTPLRYLVDGGFKNQTDIQIMHEHGIKVYLPFDQQEKPAKVTGVDDGVIKELIARMKTEEAKETYKRRASTVECVNAQARMRGLYQVVVRGLHKVQGIAALFGLAHNMMRTFVLRPI